MHKQLKILLFIIGSLVTSAIVDITLIFQFALITYSATVILYFISGLLINLKSFGYYGYLYLLPIFALNILALVLNPSIFPIFSPITFILSSSGFILGLTIKRREIRNKQPAIFFTILTMTLFLFIFFSFYYIPHFLYNSSRNKITGISNVYGKISFSNLDGTPYPLYSLKNKTVLIEYWYLDCYPCMLKMPSLQLLAHKVSSDTTIKIITVINGKLDSLDKVKEFLERHPEIQIPVLYDKSNTIRNLIKIEGYPLELIIGKDGTIMERHDGFNKDERLIYVNETFKKLTHYNKIK